MQDITNAYKNKCKYKIFLYGMNGNAIMVDSLSACETHRNQYYLLVIFKFMERMN